MVATIDLRLPKRQQYLKLAALGEAASRHAYAPFSDYQVGGACLVFDGRVYTGINTENPGIGLTIHGEMSSIVAAINDGALDDARAAGLDEYSFVKAVAILPRRMFRGWPCGHCGDFMTGFGDRFDVVVSESDGGVDWKPMHKVMPLMPDARRLRELTLAGHLFQPGQTLAVHQDKLPAGYVPTRGLGKHEAYSRLLAVAREAAQRSYAPYTKRPAGAAAWLFDGSVYSGSLVENVGYTRSGLAELAAIEAAIADGALGRALSAGVGPREFVKAVAYVPLGQPDTWPCGSARQCLCDFGLGLRIVIERADSTPATRTLKQLFPAAFAPDVLDYWVSGSQSDRGDA